MQKENKLKGDVAAIQAKNNLTKLDIAEKVSQKLFLNKRESKKVVDVFFKEISEILHSGESVKLPGFGQFKIRRKPARPGRNPRTGESFEIVARSVVTFQASQNLRKSVEFGELGGK